MNDAFASIFNSFTSFWSRSKPDAKPDDDSDSVVDEEDIRELEKVQKRYETRLVGVRTSVKVKMSSDSCPKEPIDNFKFLGLLGSGRDGDVYEVSHSKSKQVYALKVVEKSSNDEQHNRRHINEKKITYALRSKFIVRLHFVFQDVRNFYFVYERACYGSLNRVNLGVPYIEDRVKAYAVQIILAVEYLHACNIMHRDLNPTNMLVFTDGYLKLSDFGFAKVVKDRTSSAVGTLGYMAPEVVKLEPYGKIVDWWSFGVCLYEMRYKTVPFDQNPLDGWSFPKSEDPADPLNDLITKLLEADCSRRLGYGADGAQSILKHQWFDNISIPSIFLKENVYYLQNPCFRSDRIDSFEFLEKKEGPLPKMYKEF